MTVNRDDNGRRTALRQLLVSTARHESSQSQSRHVARPWLIGIAASAAVVGLAIPVAITATEPRSIPATQQSSTAAERIPAPAGVFVGDYLPFTSSSEMAQSAPVVFSGKIQSVTVPSASGSGTKSTEFGEVAVLVLTETTTIKGLVNARADGTVHLGLPGYLVGPEAFTLEALNKMFPAGSSVVTYAEQGWAADNSLGIGNVPPAGIDIAKNPTYTIWSPQGFAIQTPNSKTVQWPYVADSERGSILDALPGGSLIGSE